MQQCKANTIAKAQR